MIEINQIINEPVLSNCFVVFDKAVGNFCIVVDPGSNNNSTLLNYLNSNDLVPQFIILTHEHFDHCWGVNELRERYKDVKLLCSKICSTAIQDMKKNYSVFFEQPGFAIDAADIELSDASHSMKWNDHILEFTPAKGHSSSGIFLKIDKFIFTGDELIKDFKTVTKLKTGSKEKLKESIRYLKSMKGEGIKVCPGHGNCFLLDNYEFELLM
ncbi:MAG: MBL fold metallo-hydrolase [Muribaculaceae bacterium]|nr:MBL fold metallo-hydrolase [Muribaculaceae bacterium]